MNLDVISAVNVRCDTIICTCILFGLLVGNNIIKQLTSHHIIQPGLRAAAVTASRVDSWLPALLLWLSTTTVTDAGGAKESVCAAAVLGG